jgi:hydroxymethylbilane synthase
MDNCIKIGTRESQLAIWQATQVQQLLLQNNFLSQLVYIKSEGDIDLQTPLYEMGVQGIFTKSLDIALLNGTIDIAVHSLKDVPTQLAKGIAQAAVLLRGPVNDLLIYKNEEALKKNGHAPFIVATSSTRRKAQWLNKFPLHQICNLRGNVNTRLKKLQEENWDAAIFAQAGLERINLRPKNSIVLDWMLPAAAQGTIMLACRAKDDFCLQACTALNDANTALCTKVERDFLRALQGGCSTPIGALATINGDTLIFKGNILSIDGKDKATIEKTIPLKEAIDFGKIAAGYLLQNGGQKIASSIFNAVK